MGATKQTRCPACDAVVTEWRNPIPTVDIVIEVGEKIVLIQRANEPYGFALPGGFVDYGESLEAAALREAKEETGLTVKNLRQFRAYSDPDRDPRQHNISVVFVAEADAAPTAGDDASGVGLYDPADPPPLAFDHGNIVADYLAAKKRA
jgi:8-oxo-dGTP diphosphatase